MTGWASLTRQAAVLCLVVATGLAVTLMAINYQTRDLEKQAAALEQQIAQDRQETRVLKAEFSFLTEPERLRRLSKDLLGLTPVEPTQVRTFANFDAFLDQDDSTEQFLRESVRYDPNAVDGR
jgi:cell division protein FtsL